MNIGLRFTGFFILLLLLLLLFIFVIQVIRYMFKKTKFPKKLAITIAIVFAILLAIFIRINFFFTFESIDRTWIQEGSLPATSPNEQYVAKSYYEPYGGAVGGVNMWVEVTDLVTDTTKVIYYADAKNYVSLQWQDDTTLFVTNGNRSKLLNVETEIYHENGLACQSLVMRSRYETCYQAK